MKKATGASVLLLLLFSWVLTDAQATTSQVSPPVSVVEGNLQSDTNIFWFFEGQTTLESDIKVDITNPGIYSAGSDLTGGTISTGETVNSYLLHFDPAGNTPTGNTTIGILSFPYPILGIIVLDGSLDVTDNILGASGTTYPTGQQWRGLELGPVSVANPDTFIFDVDSITGLGGIAGILFAKDVGIDQVRVVTAVPIPTTALLLCCGIVGLVGFRRKFQR